MLLVGGLESEAWVLPGWGRWGVDVLTVSSGIIQETIAGCCESWLLLYCQGVPMLMELG